jgi:hypothetical protein
VCNAIKIDKITKKIDIFRVSVKKTKTKSFLFPKERKTEKKFYRVITALHTFCLSRVVVARERRE